MSLQGVASAYTEGVLAKRCPVCSASPGGRCLVKTVPQGMQYMMEPHVERVEAAAGRKEGELFDVGA